MATPDRQKRFDDFVRQANNERVVVEGYGGKPKATGIVPRAASENLGILSKYAPGSFHTLAEVSTRIRDVSEGFYGMDKPFTPQDMNQLAREMRRQSRRLTEAARALEAGARTRRAEKRAQRQAILSQDPLSQVSPASSNPTKI